MIKEYVVIAKSAEEQEKKKRMLGFDKGQFLCRFFKSSYMKDSFRVMPIDFAIQLLMIKDGCDMVQFKNGNYGFVVAFGKSGFEIIG